MFCRKCGTLIPDDSKFCPQCGTKVQPISANEAKSEKSQSDLDQDSHDKILTGQGVEKNFQNHFDLGIQHMSNGQIDAAIEEYHKARNLRPYNGDIYNNIGVAYYKKGEVEKAIKEYRQAIRMKSDDPIYFFNLGEALKANGATDDAIRSFRECIRLEPKESDAYFELGILLKEKGELTQALQSFDDFLNHSQDQNKKRETKRLIEDLSKDTAYFGRHTFGPELTTTADSRTSDTDKPDTDEPKGIGGWLLFWCIILVILGPLFSTLQTIGYWEQSKSAFEIYPPIRSAVILECIGNIGIILYGLIVGIMIWGRHESSITIARTYLKIRLIAMVGVVCIAFILISDLPAENINMGIDEGLRFILRELCFFGIWWMYFKKSKRVQNTFLVNTNSL